MKKIFCLIIALLTAFSLFACGGGEEKEPIFIEVNYNIESAVSSSGLDVTGEYLVYRLELKKDGTMVAVINYLGSVTRRVGTYDFDGKTLTEKYNGKKFTYTKTPQGFTTNVDNLGETVVITLKEEEKKTEVETNAVDFNSVLFGDSIDDTKKFNYCPAILTETDKDGNEVMHIWYCTNKVSGYIMDHIGYRKGVKQADGKWVFGEETIVLEPTEGTWDGRHTCDPAVIKGEFKLKGETYNYMMAYLGCVTEDYSKNETGIAVAKNVEGPWVKVDSLNPIVPWSDPKILGDGSARNEENQWGTGMPALISVDNKGEVLLFFQTTARGIAVQRWDFSNLDNPSVKFDVAISKNGSLNSNGTTGGFHIADFAFDPVKGRLYVFAGTSEKNPPDITLTRVNSHCVLAYLDGLENMEAVSAKLESMSYKWNVVGHVGPDQTGWERNHNCAIVRDGSGFVTNSSKLGVVVATGRIDYPTENIFTYRLHGWTFDVE